MDPRKNDVSKQITHLLGILKNMKSSEVGWILRELSLDLSFDRELLEILCKNIYNPKILFRELNEDDLMLILKSLDLDIVYYLYSNYREYSVIISKEFDLKKLKKIKNKFSEEEVISTLINKTIKFYEENKISYNGLLLFFNLVSCFSLPRNKSQGKIIFLEETLFPNNPYWFYVYSQTLSGKKVILKIEYSDRTTITEIEIKLDIFGRYWGMIYFYPIYGLVRVTILYEKLSYAYAEVIVTKSSCSLIDIQRFILTKNDNLFTGNGKIEHKYKNTINNNKLKYSIFCSECGSPLYYGFAHINQNSFNMEFQLNISNNHSKNRFYIQFILDEESILLIASVQKSEKIIINLEKLEERKYNKKINLEGNYLYGKNYLVISSPYENTIYEIDEKIKNNIYEEYNREIQNNIPKVSGFELNILREEIKLFRGMERKYWIKNIHCFTPIGVLEINLENDESIHSLYFSIYEFNNGWEKIAFYYSPLEDGDICSTEIDFLNPEEESRVKIYSKNKPKIEVLSPRPSKKNNYKYDYFLKYGEELKIKINQKIFSFNSNTKDVTIPFYKLENKKRDNMKSIINEIEKRIMNYQVNIPEMIIFKMYIISKNTSEKSYLQSVFSNYLAELMRFKDTQGLYFHDNIQNRELYSFILNYYINILYNRINDNELRNLFREKINMNFFRIQEDTIEFENELSKNLYKYLKYENDQLVSIEREFSILEIIIFIYLNHFKTGTNEFYVFYKYKKIKKKITSNGVLGIFEKLGITNHKEKIFRKLITKRIDISVVEKKLLDGFSPISIRDYLIIYLFFIKINEGLLNVGIDKVNETTPLSYELDNQPFIISKLRYIIGEQGVIMIRNRNPNKGLHIHFPGILRIFGNSEVNTDESYIYFEIESTVQKIEFIAKNIGKGYIFIKEIDREGKIAEFKIGLVEVVKI